MLWFPLRSPFRCRGRVRRQNNGDRPTLNQMMADPEAGQLMQDMNLFKEVVLILRHRRQERENPP